MSGCLEASSNVTALRLSSITNDQKKSILRQMAAQRTGTVDTTYEKELKSGEYETYDIEDSEDVAMLSVGLVWRF